MRRTWTTILAAALAILLARFPARAADKDTDRLANDLRPIIACLSGERQAFALSAQGDITIDEQLQHVEARLVRYGKESFDVEINHPDYGLQLRRRVDATALALPARKVVFLGGGDVDQQDQLAPQGIAKRLIGPGSLAGVYVPLLTQGDPSAAALALTGFLNVTYDPAADRWANEDGLSLAFTNGGRTLDLTFAAMRLHVEIEGTVPEPAAADDWPGLQTVEVERAELERQLARGTRRALEIFAPSPMLTAPRKKDKQVEHGTLRWIEGQRVVLLNGTPEEIGQAHGRLLKTETLRCFDSVLYVFGTIQTLRTGRWFRSDLEEAYARLAPHIPDDQKLETRALAEAVGIDPQLAETASVFPELFHCSGFAVFGSATKDGTLYHGRVLDYMTTIGLQDSAATFIVAVDGKIPFANVGYAGFTGSVSGMNARGISLGEMGGGGEGRWDGVPMATLMRRALEECSTLDEVMDLWRESPRTCEYYYVFADGKTNRAVGVAATPDSVQFILPGQSHELLGEGIEDAVVLSAGSRLKTLRQRVQKQHGQIDVEGAQALMSRPVAMQSNLHDALFVPAQGVFYVANADHDHPAAERPYVRLDLNELLKSMEVPPANAAPTTGAKPAGTATP